MQKKPELEFFMLKEMKPCPKAKCLVLKRNGYIDVAQWDGAKRLFVPTSDGIDCWTQLPYVWDESYIIAWAPVPDPYDTDKYSGMPWVPVAKEQPAYDDWADSNSDLLVSFENEEVEVVPFAYCKSVLESQHNVPLAWMPMPDIGSYATSKEGRATTTKMLVKEAVLSASDWLNAGPEQILADALGIIG